MELWTANLIANTIPTTHYEFNEFNELSHPEQVVNSLNSLNSLESTGEIQLPSERVIEEVF